MPRFSKSVFGPRTSRTFCAPGNNVRQPQISERPWAPSTGRETPVIQLALGDASIATA
jgi:hypothetical protein